jgi:YD repeat-containing protein
VACNLVSADGSSCYVQTKAINSLSHEHITYTDPFGQLTYDDRFTGNSSATYALHALTHYAYDFNGHLVTIIHPNNSTTTSFVYDAAGRKTSQDVADRPRSGRDYLWLRCRR